MGVTPRRNPELVVAVLWQNGEFSYYPARIGAKVVEAYVDKKRRLAHNLPPEKAAQPVEVGAIWSEPTRPASAKGTTAAAHIQSGHFFVENGHCGRERCGREICGEATEQITAPQAAAAFACVNPAQLAAAIARPPEGTDDRLPMRRILSFRDFDWALLGLVLLLCTVSVLEVHSATLHTKFASFGTKQIFWVAAGMAAMFIFSKIDYHRVLDWAPWAYGVGLLALAAVLSPLGHKALGGRRWIKLGPMLVQPSEFVKLVLILVVARYFANLGGRNVTWKEIFKAFALVGIPMLLVLKQPDLGTTL